MVRAWLEPGMFSMSEARKRRPNHELKQDEFGQAAIYALSSSGHGSAGETELSSEKQQRDLPLGVWTYWCSEKAWKGSLNPLLPLSWWHLIPSAVVEVLSSRTNSKD